MLVFNDFEMMLRNPRMRKCMHYLSRNPALKFKHVLEYINDPWDWTKISELPIVDWATVQKHTNLPWDFAALTKNPNITWDIIENNLKYPWVLKEFSYNPNVTLKIVLKNRIPWNWHALSETIHITGYMLREYSYLPWDYYYMSKNPHLTWDIVRNLPRKNWNWLALSEQKFVTPELIRTNIHQHWNMVALSRKIHIDEIFANPDLSWHHDYMSENPTLTWSHVHAHPEINWNINIMARVLPIKPITNPSMYYASINRTIGWYQIYDGRDWIDFRLACNPLDKQNKLPKYYAHRWKIRAHKMAAIRAAAREHFSHVMHHLHMWARDCKMAAAITANIPRILR